jgi:hypothetical protein
MPTYVVNVHLKGITPIPRHSRLDELMEILGFFPWRPGVSPEDQDEDNRLSQWEYAGNHSLDVDSLKVMIEALIRSEVEGDIDATVLQVRIRGN